jgi:16S rRNA (guanine966-N2)-methyltransferase
MICVNIQFGEHKGKIFQYPIMEGLRPTLARSRDVLFNWVQRLDGKHCLDLFAGTGILGMQALCLGATHVDFIEKNIKACSFIEKHLKTIKYENKSTVLAISVEEALKKLSQPYDMIFIDPPFEHFPLAQKAWDQLLDLKLIKPNAFIYLEIPKNIQMQLPKTTVLKHKQIGDVWIYLLQYCP